MKYLKKKPFTKVITSFLAGMVLFLPTACSVPLANSSIFVPFVLGHEEPDELSIAEPFDSYRTQYRYEENGQGFAVDSAWQAADNGYGYNLYQKSTVIMPGAGGVMSEGAHMDELAYKNLHHYVGIMNRSADYGPPPSLLLEADSASSGSLVHLPIAVSALISHTEPARTEHISGLMAARYVITDTMDPLLNEWGYTVDMLDTISAYGEFWLTIDNRYVLQYLVTIESTDETRPFRRQNEYLAYAINEEFPLIPPEYQAEVEERRQQWSEGLIPHPVCEACILPLYPNSTISTHQMSERILVVQSHVDAPSEPEAILGYEQMLTDAGWNLSPTDDEWRIEDAIHLKFGEHKFSIVYSFDNTNQQLRIELIPDEL